MGRNSGFGVMRAPAMYEIAILACRDNICHHAVLASAYIMTIV